MVTFLLLIFTLAFVYWGCIRYHMGWPISENEEVLSKLKNGEYKFILENGHFPVILLNGDIDSIVSMDEAMYSIFDSRFVDLVPLIEKYHLGYSTGEGYDKANFIQVEEGSELYEEIEKIFDEEFYSEQVRL